MTASDGTAFRFGVDAGGNYGYIVTGEDGADAVIPFKKKILVGTITGNGTIDVSSYAGYEHFSADDFLMEITRVDGSFTGNSQGDSSIQFRLTPTLSYNAGTGKITLSNMKGTWYTQGGVAKPISLTATASVYMI